jgi:hypothetical protein
MGYSCHLGIGEGVTPAGGGGRAETARTIRLDQALAPCVWESRRLATAENRFGMKYGRYGDGGIDRVGSARPPGLRYHEGAGCGPWSGRTLHIQLASDHAAGVMSPNNPSASWLGPAVK